MYEYKCDECGNIFELIQKFSDEPLTVHEGCGGHVERLISVSALQFKGTGWYVTDYGKSNGKGGKSEDSGKKEESGKKADSGKSENGKSENGKKDSGKSDSGSTGNASPAPATSSASSDSKSSAQEKK